MTMNTSGSATAHDLLELARAVILAESAALARSASSLEKSFLEALDKLDTAKDIFVCGVGKSGLIAQKIAATLSSVGHPAHFLHPVEAMHGDLGKVGIDSVVILLSKSGGSAELVSLFPTLKKRKIFTIGIIGRRDSYLGRAVDVFLDASVEQEACGFDIVPTTSTTVALSIGDALAISLMKKRNFQPTDFAAHHPFGQLGRNLRLSVAEVMHGGIEGLPLCTTDTPFRHALIESSAKALGCVCVVDAEMHLMGLITDGDVRRALQSHEDIRELRAADVMTRSPLCATSSMTLQEALQIMEQGERQISVLPVSDEAGRCIGILRLHDILQVNN